MPWFVCPTQELTIFGFKVGWKGSTENKIALTLLLVPYHNQSIEPSRGDPLRWTEVTAQDVFPVTFFLQAWLYNRHYCLMAVKCILLLHLTFRHSLSHPLSHIDAQERNETRARVTTHVHTCECAAGQVNAARSKHYCWLTATSLVKLGIRGRMKVLESMSSWYKLIRRFQPAVSINLQNVAGLCFFPNHFV